MAGNLGWDKRTTVFSFTVGTTELQCVPRYFLSSRVDPHLPKSRSVHLLLAGKVPIMLVLSQWDFRLVSERRLVVE